jgi:cysteine desulfurase / selenocysteine lyase
MREEAFDLSRARAETPGAGHVVHLNNAGAGLAPQPLIDAMSDYLRLEYLMGAYEAAESSQDAFERTHQAIAELINCGSGEIAILDSATRAWSTALSSIPLRAGDRVLISPVEYGSNYISLLYVAERLGASLEVLPVDVHGVVDVAQLEAMVDERVKLIAVVHVPMHDGLVNPVAAIGAVAGRHSIPYLVDACQSVGQMPVDVHAIGCDLLVGSGRKFLRGPRGTGFLYVRAELADQLIPPLPGLDGAEWLDGTYRLAAGARRFETWETNCASRIGLGVAVDYALGWGVETTWQRVRALSEKLREDISSIVGVRLEDRGVERGASVAVSFEGHDAHEVRRTLLRAGHQHMGVPGERRLRRHAAPRLGSLLRISPHYYNSVAELDRLCSALESLTAAEPARVFA